MQARPPEQVGGGGARGGGGGGGKWEFLASSLSPVVTFDPVIGSSA